MGDLAHTLTILDDDLQRLSDVVFSRPGAEGAAYLLCGRSVTHDEVRLLVRDLVPVADEHYLIRRADRLSIDSASYASVAKRAGAEGCAVLFAHSHPGSLFHGFSPQDDREEPRLHAFLAARAPSGPHGSLLLSGSPNAPQLRARVWTAEGWVDVRRIRVVGARFRFYDRTAGREPLPEFFDRQVRAFGPEVQRLLQRLHTGVVGGGGTGSAVREQLLRLGVGRVSEFDGDVLTASNVSRVYGSGAADAGRYKVVIGRDHADRVGMGTSFRPFPTHITDETTARTLRECDVVFSCTDKERPRGILVQLALRYLIPVFDLGVKIDSVGGVIRGIYGRVTTLLPGEACLFCRRRISSEAIALESLTPEQRRALAEERYAPELDTDDPAVITFTTAVASQAVSEFLHRLTGFMGAERRSSEVLLFFHESLIRTNRQVPDPECLCAPRRLWGRGDSRDFLGLTWGAA